MSKSTPSPASIGSQDKAEAGPVASATTGAAGELYRTREVVALLGISRRQLQYWAQTDPVVPSLKTRGGHHRYSFEDLVALKATKQLIDGWKVRLQILVSNPP